MKRRLFNLLAAGSLVMGCAAVALWTFSYFVGWTAFYTRTDDHYAQWFVQSNTGSVGIARHCKAAIQVPRDPANWGYAGAIIESRGRLHITWHFSDDQPTTVQFDDGSPRLYFSTERGPRPVSPLRWWHSGSNSEPSRDFLGWTYESRTDIRPIKGADKLIVAKLREQSRFLRIPWWSVSLALALLPAFWLRAFLRRARQRRRERLGHCGHCGYDLRASKNRCPECGTAVPPGHTAEVGH
jgi:hypothetical protein